MPGLFRHPPFPQQPVDQIVKSAGPTPGAWLPTGGDDPQGLWWASWRRTPDAQQALGPWAGLPTGKRQYLTVPAIPSKQAWGIPTITGGATALDRKSTRLNSSHRL